MIILMTTSRQAQVIKLIAEKGSITGKDLEKIGYSQAVVKSPTKVTRTRAVQSELAKVLKKNNITLKRAIKPIDDALKATKPDIVDKNGKFIKGDIDHQTRLRASEMAMKLLQLNQPETKPKEQRTLQPELAAALARGDVDEIQRIIFNKPQEQTDTESITAD